MCLLLLLQSKMMMYEYGPKDLHKVTKHLKQAGQALAPFSLYVMRACRTCTERSLEQRSADRRALKARLEAFLQEEGDKVRQHPLVVGMWLAECRCVRCMWITRRESWPA